MAKDGSWFWRWPSGHGGFGEDAGIHEQTVDVSTVYNGAYTGQPTQREGALCVRLSATTDDSVWAPMTSQEGTTIMNEEDYRQAEALLRAVVEHPALIRRWYALEGDRLLEQLRTVTDGQDAGQPEEPPLADPASTD